METNDSYRREINIIYDLLNTGKIDEIRTMKNSSILASILEENGTEFICNISAFLDVKKIQDFPEKVLCYKELLKIIAERIDPESAFISFLEQLDEEKCSVEKFMMFIHPIQVSLHRLSKSRGYWLEWALSTFKCYLDSVPAIEDHQVELDEKKKLVNDKFVDTIIKLCETLMVFFESFINNLDTSRESEALIVFGFQIFLEPAMYVYIENFQTLQQIYTQLVASIDRLIFSVHQFLDCLDDRYLSNIEKRDPMLNKDANSGDTYPSIWDRLMPKSLAMYYSAKIVKEPFTRYFPLVFDKLYLFHKLLFLSLTLIRHTHNAVISKGLALGQKLLKSMDDGSIPYFYLDLLVHQEFIKFLSSISVHSYIFENRKSAIELLQSYIRKFDSKGTYILFQNISSVVDNPDVDSEIITAFRNDMYHSFVKNELKFYQNGMFLVNLLKIFCNLEDISTVHLMKNKNKIISIINLIALIVRRDQNNDTGFHDHFSYFKANYFIPLRSNAEKSREEFLKEIDNVKKGGGTAEEKQFNVVVDGSSLPTLGKEEKLNVMQSALMALSMIEYTLNLVHEYSNKKVL